METAVAALDVSNRDGQSHQRGPTVPNVKNRSLELSAFRLKRALALTLFSGASLRFADSVKTQNALTASAGVGRHCRADRKTEVQL